MQRHDMAAQWVKLFPNCSVEVALGVYREVMGCYRQTGRYYHTDAHIYHMLSSASRYFPDLPYDEVLMAVWFHDAICVPGAVTNEQASAKLARLRLPSLGVNESQAELTAQIILTTKDHVPTCAASAILCDLDLLSLGLPQDVYRQNTAKIREEYRAYPDDMWRAGRLGFIKRFSQRPYIYSVIELRDRFEHAARINLRNEQRILERA